MPKLSDNALNHIRSESERIQYGKITLIINPNMPDVDIVVEEGVKFSKEIPGAGKSARRKPGGLHQG